MHLADGRVPTKVDVERLEALERDPLLLASQPMRLLHVILYHDGAGLELVIEDDLVPA